jgi:uncharacterized protein (TIGR02145 family)
MPITSLSDVQIDLTAYQDELINRTDANLTRLNERLAETTDPAEQARLSGLISEQTSYLFSLEAGLITQQANDIHASLVEFQIGPNQTSPSPLLEETQTGFQGGVSPGPGIWAGTNLVVTEYQNGDPIPLITDQVEWQNATGGAYCYYENNPDNLQYGLLYNYYTILDPRGLAPDGWRVSLQSDWTDLISYYTPNAADKLRETGNSHWVSGPTATTNVSGMTILPGGYRKSDGTSGEDLGSDTYFWQYNPSGLPSDASGVFINTGPDVLPAAGIQGYPNYGCSIRLVKI